MDLSDGLADAVRQIAEASGTGAIVDASALPIDPAAARWFQGHGTDPVLGAVSGGDDYELLFTLPRKTARRLRSAETAARGVPLTHIGELTTEPELVVVRDGQSEPLPSGFTHF